MARLGLLPVLEHPELNQCHHDHPEKLQQHYNHAQAYQ
jgi:hypothetical protein